MFLLIPQFHEFYCVMLVCHHTTSHLPCSFPTLFISFKTISLSLSLSTGKAQVHNFFPFMHIYTSNLTPYISLFNSVFMVYAVVQDITIFREHGSLFKRSNQSWNSL